MIINMPCYSLFHLSRDTRWKLAGVDMRRGHKVAADDEGDNLFLTRPAEYGRNHPDDLRRVLDTLAPTSEFGWILLSIDGDKHPDLPTY